MDLKDIKAIIDLMKKNSIAEFEMEKQDFKIRLKRVNTNVPVDETLPQAGGSELSTRIPATTQSSVSIVPGSASAEEVEIKSPMIGTFYVSPSPEAASYVEMGSEVSPETVVCIIEAMKVMNEIKAEVRGIVTKVLVDNAKPVEFGQPLFRIKPN